jgi:fructose-specific phosphotransferase system IIC component
MYKPIILAVTRHLAGAVGVALVAKGVLEPDAVTGFIDNAEVVVGAAFSIGALVASIIDKRKGA